MSPGSDPFKATLNTGMFCDFNFVKANLSQENCQVVDARSPGRFHSTEPEPRPNFPSGHIPHSKNVPYAQCLDPETKLMKTPEVSLASYLCGKRDTMVYDGSWVEWGQRASPDMIEKS